MGESLLLLLAALIGVFIAAQLFTNALEYLGERLGVSEGVTGSIFAAVGTAMPETIVPLVAILAGGAAVEVNQAVGLGAILGAPFMLGTLSLGVMALFSGLKSGWKTHLRPEHTGLQRDILVFLSGFGVAVIAALLPVEWQAVRTVIAISLLLGYFMYLLATIRASQRLVADGHGTESDQELYAGRILSASLPLAAIQLGIGLVLLVGGARMFVGGAESLSELLGISALVISLLIIPVATELPEKVNSVIWIRRRKDTLAFGNITGAMVFQGTIIPAIGMMIMPWHFDSTYAFLSVILAMAGSAWLWFLTLRHRITPLNLMLNAALYGIFIVAVIFV